MLLLGAARDFLETQSEDGNSDEQTLLDAPVRAALNFPAVSCDPGDPVEKPSCVSTSSIHGKVCDANSFPPDGTTGKGDAEFESHQPQVLPREEKNASENNGQAYAAPARRPKANAATAVRTNGNSEQDDFDIKAYVEEIKEEARLREVDHHREADARERRRKGRSRKSKLTHEQLDKIAANRDQAVRRKAKRFKQQAADNEPGGEAALTEALVVGGKITLAPAPYDSGTGHRHDGGEGHVNRQWIRGVPPAGVGESLVVGGKTTLVPAPDDSGAGHRQYDGEGHTERYRPRGVPAEAEGQTSDANHTTLGRAEVQVGEGGGEQAMNQDISTRRVRSRSRGPGGDRGRAANGPRAQDNETGSRETRQQISSLELTLHSAAMNSSKSDGPSSEHNGFNGSFFQDRHASSRDGNGDLHTMSPSVVTQRQSGRENESKTEVEPQDFDSSRIVDDPQNADSTRKDEARSSTEGSRQERDNEGALEAARDKVAGISAASGPLGGLLANSASRTNGATCDSAASGPSGGLLAIAASTVSRRQGDERGSELADAVVEVGGYPKRGLDADCEHASLGGDAQVGGANKKRCVKIKPVVDKVISEPVGDDVLNSLCTNSWGSELEFEGMGICTETSSSASRRTAETKQRKLCNAVISEARLPESDDERSSERELARDGAPDVARASEECSLSDPTGGLQASEACSLSDPTGGLHASGPEQKPAWLSSLAEPDGYEGSGGRGNTSVVEPDGGEDNSGRGSNALERGQVASKKANERRQDKMSQEAAGHHPVEQDAVVNDGASNSQVAVKGAAVGAVEGDGCDDAPVGAAKNEAHDAAEGAGNDAVDFDASAMKRGLKRKIAEACSLEIAMELIMDASRAEASLRKKARHAPTEDQAMDAILEPYLMDVRPPTDMMNQPGEGEAVAAEVDPAAATEVQAAVDNEIFDLLELAEADIQVAWPHGWSLARAQKAKLG